MRWTETRLLLCLAALGTLPYLNAATAGFTFDDVTMILDNDVVTQSAWPLERALTTAYEPGSLYRPLTFLTYWLNQQLDPGRAVGFHAVNVGLHVLVTILVYRFAQILLAPKGALAAAVVFAVHPIHTEAVTSIVGRAELLAAAAVLGALLCAHRARSDRSRFPWLGLGAALLVAGLLSKESAFVALPLLVVVRAASDRRGLGAAVIDTASSRAGLVFATAGLSYLALRVALFGGLTLPEPPSWLDNPLAHASLPIRLATAAAVLSKYAGLLILPLRLSADYSFDQVPAVVSVSDPRLLIALLLAVCTATLLWTSRASLPAAPLALLFTGASLAITANVAFPIGTIMAERLLYLPSVGACVLAGGIAAVEAQRRPHLTSAVLMTAVLLMAGRTWARNADWQSNLTLFGATVGTSPFSAKAHHNLGVALKQRGDYDGADIAFRRALALYPDYDRAAFGIARMHELRGSIDAALHWYDEALRINPDLAKAHLNRGGLLHQRGRVAVAERAFRTGLLSAPSDPRLLTGLGLARLARGDAREAAVLFARATEIGGTPDVAARVARLALGNSGDAPPESL